MSTKNIQLVQKALEAASSQLRKTASQFKSERQLMAEKIAELEKALESGKRAEKAHKLALRMLYDDEAVREIYEKEAALLREDLAVVEKALELNLPKIATIGELDTPIDPIQKLIFDLKS